MRVPYGEFRIKIDQFNRLCGKYGEIFGFRPHFHVLDFSNEIFVKFRILTTSPISIGSITHNNTPATKLEKIPLVTNAKAVLNAPVTIAVVSGGSVVNEGNPFIIK